MADLWMDVDAALSKVPVNLMPLIDDTDFKSIEADVNYNATGLVLIWHFVTTAGAYTQTAVTPTDTGGSYDWVEQGNGMFTIEIPATDPGGGTIWNDTEGFGWFTGVATGVLPWRGPVIGFRAGINDRLIDSANDATRGLAGTALPAAVAGAASGLPLKAASGNFLNVANLPQVAAGGTNGLLISGSNTGTTTLAALTVTGALTAKNVVVNNNSGVGVAITGTTIGLDINATGGVGVDIDGTTSGVTADGGNGAGLHAGGTTFGIQAVASGGPALSAVSSGGHGIVAGTTNDTSDGINAYGDTTGDGLHLTGGATGHGISSLGGATSGHGIHAQATDGNGCGIYARGEQTANGTGCGIHATGSVEGAGMTLAGGSTSGSGLKIDSTSGAAVDISATSGIGVDIDGSTDGMTTTGAAGSGLSATGTTYGVLASASAATGVGLGAVGTGNSAGAAGASFGGTGTMG